MSEFDERIESALGAMRAAPRNLVAYLRQPGPDFTKASADDVERMLNKLLCPDPNDRIRLLFSTLLRSWDNAKDAKWANGTARNTASRRQRIHELLKLTPEFQNRIDSELPFYPIEEPVIIAEEHKDWYAPEDGIRDYYWQSYKRYLRDQKRWPAESLLGLDNTTRAIVECLANPESKKAYASRGLVMGYVQSGKTSNFAGLVARAADAGYRMIIVLAGTWNILRNQTQRRFDKELLGKEFLQNDDTYQVDRPPDWDEFLEHGTDPVQLGQFAWQRLTRPDIDFRRLKQAIDSLEFERVSKALPLYAPANLHALPVKLLVVKKHSGISAALAKDLKLIRTKLSDLPTLIIDDESDQAGINTVDPKRIRSGSKERSKTNLRIVELLKVFPRGQCVGYTATPYANALVDPEDPEDLFPKDFIVSLERPVGYMGVSDFFDPLTDYADLDKNDYSLPEIAFIRRVENPQGADDEDLQKALRAFVLAGAMKLFRLKQDPRRYNAEQFKHHTMLIHTSHLTGEQVSLAGRIQDLWNRCAFNTPAGLQSLQSLWENDYAKVCSAMQPAELNPREFKVLIPHLSDTIRRVERGTRFVLVVNYNSPDAPDFSAAPVWKIIIGGNKLSRGYTIEGLTVSYYRRAATTADTLMQMGRWFGFRPGYKDLVRVFLGTRDGKKGDVDLVSLFKEVCRMEERFRDELTRYVRRPDAARITPKQIPPLISVSGVLPPTARNKMFNAVLADKNFGGSWSMLTLTASEALNLDANVKALQSMLAAARQLGKTALGGQLEHGKTTIAESLLFETSNKDLIKFLKAYRWLESEYRYPDQPSDVGLQIEFLEKHNHGIKSWLVIAPQRKSSFGPPLGFDLNFTVRRRDERDRVTVQNASG
jgi:hypothetical protein